MKSLSKGVGPLLLAAALSGCSLFGVATKSDLERHGEAEEARRQELQTLLTRVRTDLGAVDAELDGVRAELQSARADWGATDQRVLALDRDLAEVSGQWLELDAAVRSVHADVDSVLAGVEGVQADLGFVRGTAEMASARSEVTLRTYYRALVREREQILQRLQAVEEEMLALSEAESMAVESDSRMLP